MRAYIRFLSIYLITTLAGAQLEDNIYFNPKIYLNNLPSLSMPYVDSVPIPIKPTRALKTTKMVSFVTKYVYRNPVCIKYTARKPSCSQTSVDDGTKDGGKVIYSKEILVRDKALKNRGQMAMRRRTGRQSISSGSEDERRTNGEGADLEASETGR